MSRWSANLQQKCCRHLQFKPAVLAIWTSARSEKSEYILAEGRKASGINDAARQRVTP